MTSLVLGTIITQKNQTKKNGLILSLFILHSPNRLVVFQDVFSQIFPMQREPNSPKRQREHIWYK
ncbi:protein of unknown function [Streptococcus thermophilus]|uniref:Uncharacterized protein n=1 Tax=Streptococcus thermophilus TaxID=1308 RepID=A0AAU9H627_STRTR|nr:protein of unknown function [Streptococcus thermophilus]CAD0166991.1 protein of unknown function [Streptococcus thermophilus]